MSKTIVYQSYRTENVPGAIARCMQTVKAWATLKGYDYRFYDDAFLAKVPTWLSDKTKDMLLTTDFARVQTALELHEEGYDRAIWADADLAIFDPEEMALPPQHGFGFCREWWFEPTDEGDYAFRKRVNNCFCYFDKGDGFAPYYLQAMKGMLELRGSKIISWEFSTVPLTRIHKAFPFPLINSVVTLSPIVRGLLLNGNKPVVEQQIKAHTETIRGVHLAFSANDKEGEAILDVAMARKWPFDGVL